MPRNIASIAASVVLVIGLPIASARSQCTISQPSNASALGAGNLGQTFTACGTGVITSIQVEVHAISNAAVTLHLQAGPNGVPSPTYSQAVTMALGVNLISLTSLFPVTLGNEYSMALYPTGTGFNLKADTTNPYLGGRAFFSPGGVPTFLNEVDLTMEIAIDDHVGIEPATWSHVRRLFHD